MYLQIKHNSRNTRRSGFTSVMLEAAFRIFTTERESWQDVLNHDLVVMPGSEETNGDCTLLDHPLSINPDSQWQTYFKDNEVLLQIDKDVRRLCPDISFFQQPTDYPCSQIVNNSASSKKAQEDYQPMTEGQEAHWEVVERILFLYAKLNPGQGYVQGMNEIIGPIYYTFARDQDAAYREYAEADCFFCFTNLMSEIRDFFIKTLDSTDCGINNMMVRLTNQLRESDFDIWLHFQQLELRPEYYGFRWITLLLSQEFPLPDVLRIWDTLFSDENRFNFLIYICCAMIM
ncbi:tbc1 domain family member gtpase-activating protein [Holotrichia oblita]|uniref:Tbc1 domain family member gtpase-activating protein n=1 Tax=Holotrichia oblita TaxID=644536 RepID=A0ACB9TXY6_HOLOL|nr:tbc1 domain family member gtpase-activating protein [Holotrichia oblita]